MHFSRILTGLLLLISCSSFAQSGWQLIANPAPGGTTTFYDVHFLNDDVGMVTGENFMGLQGLALITYNGGTAWNMKTFPGTYTDTGIMFDGSTAVVAGSKNGLAFFARTTDGGTTWTEWSDSSGSGVNFLAHAEDSVGFATLNSFSPDSSYLYRTTDAGFSWHKILTDTLNLQEVAFSNSQQGVAKATASGSGTYLLYTSNGGTSFILADTAAGIYVGPDLEVGGTGYVCEGIGPAKLRKTTNSGASWGTAVTTPINVLNGAAVRNASVGMAFGAGGIVILTTDGGSAWLPDTLPTNASITNGEFTDNYAYLVGDNGVILKKVVAIPVEIPEPTISAAILPAPNPASESLSFKIPREIRGNINISLHSLQGRRLTEKSGSSAKGVRFDIQDWPAGAYFYRIVVNGALLQSGKWMKN